MKIHELLIEKKDKTDAVSAFSRLSAAARGEDPEFAVKPSEPKVEPNPAAKADPVNYDTPTALRKGINVDQTPPEDRPKGTVADVGKKQSQPGQRQRGDIVKQNLNTLQWTGEPGKEWMIAGGPLITANPATDRRNRIISQNGKRYMAAADAKELLSVESR